MMFNANFDNTSVMSWRSVLLVEETRENNRLGRSHWNFLQHNVVSNTPNRERDSYSQR